MVPTWLTNWLSASGILIQSVVMLFFTGCLSGCTVYSNGGGEMGMGYRSESKVFVYHKAEEGNKAKASASSELSEPASEWLFNRDRPQDPAGPVTQPSSAGEGTVIK